MTTSAARSDAPPVRSRRALLAGSVGNTVPACTGARAARVLGSITPGTRPLQLPCPTEHLVNSIIFTQR